MGPVNKFVKDLTFKHAVKIEIGLSLSFFLLATSPIEYFLAVVLAVMAYLDYEDGAPLL